MTSLPCLTSVLLLATHLILGILVYITGLGPTVSELDVSVLFPLQILVIQYALDMSVCFCYRSWSYSIRTRCECVVSITGPGHTVSELDMSVCFCYRSWSYSIRTRYECVFLL